MSMNHNLAQKVLSAAVEKAGSTGIPVSIAVVDSGGYLMAFARLDSVCGVIDFAVKKAKTAILFGADSDVMGDIISGAGMHGYGMLNTNDGLLTLAGGIIIKDADSKVIGAIGVSGGTPEQDKGIAEAGAAIIA
ncbi:protein glcG [Chryseobacterium indologenes]|uniref:Protein glcG n=2 Tax=Chryseobacterium indologenes TaxID=253 RepID=A0A0N0IVY0_CHRID|nr:protein glcG [Chryseobacterium indologenes]